MSNRQTRIHCLGNAWKTPLAIVGYVMCNIHAWNPPFLGAKPTQKGSALKKSTINPCVFNYTSLSSSLSLSFISPSTCKVVYYHRWVTRIRLTLQHCRSSPYDPYIPNEQAEGATSSPNNKTQRVQHQVDEVVNIMQDNIDQMYKRGENLNSLQNKTGKWRQIKVYIIVVGNTFFLYYKRGFACNIIPVSTRCQPSTQANVVERFEMEDYYWRHYSCYFGCYYRFDCRYSGNYNAVYGLIDGYGIHGDLLCL